MSVVTIRTSSRTNALKIQRFLLLFLPPFLPPLRLPAFPALEIAAARDFDMPLRLRALYLSLSFMDFPATRISFEHTLVTHGIIKLLSAAAGNIEGVAAARIAVCEGEQASYRASGRGHFVMTMATEPSLRRPYDCRICAAWTVHADVRQGGRDGPGGMRHLVADERDPAAW